MKNQIFKVLSTMAILLAGMPLMAQGAGSTGSTLVITLIAAVVLLLVLGVVVRVADSLLAIEAKQSGIDDKGVNFTVLPSLSELLGTGQKVDVAGNLPVHVAQKGFDLLLKGEATGPVKEATSATRFAVQPPNFIGIKPIPKMLVEEGQTVKAGDPLFFDKASPDILYVAPVSGEVIAINRGEKRSIIEVVILADRELKYRDFGNFNLESGNREALVQHLLASGAWPLIRQRPYNVIADPADTPRDIFVSTFDTAPMAPDLNLVVEGREASFQRGLDVLNRLTDGMVYLGLDGRGKTTPSKAFTEAKGVEKHYFKGKHPIGNVGVQIHHISPIGSSDKVWTLGVQEVITLGALFTEKRFNAERVIALTGAELKEPKYVRSYLGANLKELLSGNTTEGTLRIISGDVLSGEQKAEDSYVNFYDDQVSVVLEGDYYEPFGWLLPLSPRPSISRTFPYTFFPNYKFRADTNTHGEKRAFVVTGQYEEVFPMDILPQHLMKAIMANDFERMEGLGIYELVEEDIAICEFVCTSKQPLQAILREGLDTMREQG
jgi:Na+-transporting NADH:ubiquinone oxidoreductase subunit A